MRRRSPSTFAALVALLRARLLATSRREVCSLLGKKIYSRHIVILLRILPLAEGRPLGRPAHGARER
jgi:hypothetical protein